MLEQETAELDMSAVLGESAASLDAAPPPEPGVPEFGPVRAQRIVPDPAGRRLRMGGPGALARLAGPAAPARQGSFVFE